MQQQAPESSSCALLSQLRTIMEGGSVGTTTELHRVLGSAVGPILAGWPE